MYYAHIKENEKQLLKDHLENVAELASDFAKEFDAEETAKICGILHDLGKYSKEFKRRLDGENIKVDHATAGAQEVMKIYKKDIARIIAYIISGHHTGLQDGGSENKPQSLSKRLKKELKDYSSYKSEINPPASPRN